MSSADVGECLVAVVNDREDSSPTAGYRCTYYGYRTADGRWFLTSLTGEHLMWDFPDEQIVVLGRAS